MKAMAFVLMMIPMMASAGVEDFNSLINENASAQKELHREVKTQVGETRLALEENENRVIVDNSLNDSVHVRTKKSLLRFRKETVDHKVRQKDMDKRLANEFNSADMEF